MPIFFRIRWRKLGGHYHCRVFSGANPSGTFAKLGELVMDERDWPAFQEQAGRGWTFIQETGSEEYRNYSDGFPLSETNVRD